MFKGKTEQQAKDEILKMVAAFYKDFRNDRVSYGGGQRIPYASRVYDQSELVNLVDSSLEFWLTAGRFTEEFESEFPKIINSKYCSLVNSGSSANLLAFMALTSPLLKERRVLPGDEIITVAAAFPTTVSPVVQYGAVPVFVDITIPEYNIDVSQLDESLSEKTKAVFVAHTLGNPVDLGAIKAFCDKHELWLLEDNCDALGSKYNLQGDEKYTGTIGDIGTSSFYPAHQMTTGEGGAVYTSNPLLHKIVRSLRDWGRDCTCPGGKDNLCGHRFDGQYGELPRGYDHKYVYSHFGYNMKVTDLQAAIGVAQMKKVLSFAKKRSENFHTLKSGMMKAGVENAFILPEETKDSTASWFGFPITCQQGVSKNEVVEKLERSGIQTRSLFAGNLIRHPCFDEMRKSGTGYRVIGRLEQTDRSMNDTFWIGVYPGLSDEQLAYMIGQVSKFAKQF